MLPIFENERIREGVNKMKNNFKQWLQLIAFITIIGIIVFGIIEAIYLS